MNKFTKLLAATALTAFAGIASAVPITGSIGFAGAYTLDGTNFLDSSTITRTDFEVHGDTSGSFLDEGIVSGTLATGADFTYNPVTVPVPDIWSVGSFMMDLSNMSVDFSVRPHLWYQVMVLSAAPIHYLTILMVNGTLLQII